MIVLLIHIGDIPTRFGGFQVKSALHWYVTPTGWAERSIRIYGSLGSGNTAVIKF